MSRVSFLRHAGWFSPEYASKLTIIGVGATGSHIALLAAKMGFHEFEIWDADIVEEHNLPNQAYDLMHVGKQKVEALRDVLQRFNPDIKVTTNPRFFTAADAAVLSGCVVVTVDTMSARKDIIEACDFNPMVEMVFETRLGFTHGEVNVIDNMTPSQVNAFKATLFRDEDIPEGPCNQRIVTTLVNMISSWAVHNICDFRVHRAKKQKWERTGKKYLFNVESGLQTYEL